MSSLEFSVQGKIERNFDDFLSEIGTYSGEEGALTLAQLSRNLAKVCGAEFDISEYGSNWNCSVNIEDDNFDLLIDAGTSTRFDLFDTLIEVFQTIGLKDWKASYFDSSTGSRFAWRFEDGELVDEEFDLNDLRVVFTGRMEEGTREEMQELAEDYGAIVQSSVNGATDMLVTGVNVGMKKIEKAKSLGVKIITEQEFMESLEYIVDV